MNKFQFWFWFLRYRVWRPQHTQKQNRPACWLTRGTTPTMLPTTRSQSRREEPRRQVAGKRGRVFAAVILGFCVLSFIDTFHTLEPYSGDRHRSLLSSAYLATTSTLLPWAHHYLVDVNDAPNPDVETALFWHIPKSGGTTAKRLYQCMGKTLAHRVGADPRFGHDEENEIVVFEPHEGKDWKVVNVDTTIKPGILRARKLGLVQSHSTDLIFTMEPAFAGEQLYDEDNKGRFLALFRHPVDRASSLFFYLQKATWEKTYRPEWADMTVMEWANLKHLESNYMVRKLVGKKFGDSVDEMDLIIAKELVRQRFIVGLMDEMVESIRRFNIVLGVDESSDRSQQCMEEFGLIAPEDVTPAISAVGDGSGEESKTHAAVKKNSNQHPKFVQGDPEFDAIAARNPLDMVLYSYILQLFEDQKLIIDSYFVEAEDEEDVRQLWSLLPPGADDVTSRLPSKIQANLANINDPVQDKGSETPFFWHIPKSGGTTLQRMYFCMGFTLANEVGGNLKFDSNRSKIDVISPWSDNPGKVINVDVTSQEGITEAKNRGFFTQKPHPHLDLVSSPEFKFAATTLFSPEHKGRMFALFRHPIDRAVSKFYYLQKATWESTYRKRWKNMTLEQWAEKKRGENNWMVRNLVGKDGRAVLTTEDLELAKEIVRTKFVVGLMDSFDESVHRFNIFLGVNESEAVNQECIGQFTSNGGDSHASANRNLIKTKNQWNSYGHPDVEHGSPAWVSLSKINFFDMLLYRYVLELFEEQRSLFNA